MSFFIDIYRRETKSTEEKGGICMSNRFFDEEHKGVLSDKNILEAIHNGEIYIAPFDKAQLQPAGYNLTPTRFFYSTKKKRFLSIIENSDEVYVMIDRNDTVLVRTRESVAVSSALSGAFYSKVKVVSEGFGHVSTTLDPNWEGQLLISLNNPTNRKLKFSIEKKAYGKTIYNSFVTVEFMGLDSIPLKRSDNPPGRLDILESTVEKNISTFKRKEVDELRQLLGALHKCEERTLESLLFKRLNSEEKKVWKEIYTLQNDEEFDDTLKSFMEEKKKKYLRLLQEDFCSNAQMSISIINEYITKKQRYLPIRTKIWEFCKKNKYRLVGMLMALALGLSLYIIAISSNSSDPLELDANQMGIIYSALSSCILYIIFPIIKSIFIDSRQ